MPLKLLLSYHYLELIKAYLQLYFFVSMKILVRQVRLEKGPLPFDPAFLPRKMAISAKNMVYFNKLNPKYNNFYITVYSSKN